MIDYFCTINKYNNMRTLNLILILSLFSLAAFSQSGTVKGVVTNESNNEPVPFVTVQVYGTTIATTTDVDGNYTLTGIKPGFEKLIVTSVGFDTKITEEFMLSNARAYFLDIAIRESVASLKEVVVAPSYFLRKDDAPVSVRMLGLAEIERAPGANRDISKVIQSLPGVAVTPAQRNDVIVRGGGSSENRYYLDDVEIPNLNHFATQGASGGAVGIINVDFVKNVDLYSGAFPSNRGNALSSVLEFSLVDGNHDKMKYKATLGASDLGLTIDGPLGKKATIIASARRSYLQLLFTAIGLPFLPTYNDFQFKVKVPLKGKDELTFIGLGALDEFALNSGIKNPDEEQQYILDYIPVNEQWTYTVGAVYKHYKDKGYDTWVLSRNYLNNVQYKYRNNIEVPSNKLFDYSSHEDENKFRYEHTSFNNGYKIKYGAGIEEAEYGIDNYQILFRNSSLDTLDYESSISLFKWHAFAQATRSYFSKKLTLSLGLRSDANNYSASMSNMAEQISPRFSASYMLTQKLFLNFNTGRYYQQPPYTSMGYRDANGVLANKSNNLKYMISDHVVAGFEYKPTDHNLLNIEGFYKGYHKYLFSVNDSISLANKGADFGTYGDEPVVSTGTGRAYGLEVLIREKLYKGFNVTLAYTYVRSEFKNVFDVYVPSAWDSRHIFNITATRTFKRNWDLGFKWRYVGGNPYTPADEYNSSLVNTWNVNGRALIDYNQFNTLRLSAFHQLDIRIDKQYFFNKWSLMAYFDVQNAYNFKSEQPPTLLLDRDENGQAVIVNPDAPANQQRYKMKYLNPLGGTVLPTIGIIVEI